MSYMHKGFVVVAVFGQLLIVYVLHAYKGWVGLFVFGEQLLKFN